MRHWSPKAYRWNSETPPWRRHRRWFFRRFVMSFMMMMLFLAGIMVLLARLFTRYFGGDSEITLLVLVGGCSLFLTLPIVALSISWTIFQRMATPVAQVMAVAEAVADGDLSARVEATSGGRFGRLSRSINHMVAELERTHEQRRQLTADIAHELRTPLHIIQGNLEGILDGVYKPTKEHIQNTLEDTQMLARLVEDLGTLSLAESGQLPLVIESVDIAELLIDVQTSFSGQADSRGIELQVTMPSHSPLFVQGDIMRLVQMLGNLVSNAIRHTPSGGTIALRASEQKGAVCLEVEDTGEGIAEKDLPHVFGRFWRGDHARTHAAGVGAGLGLAIAQQLAQAHGGAISVKSTLGVGTTFTVLLPDKPAD